MSIPHYYDDGCVWATTLNRIDNCPIYLRLSPTIIKEKIDSCPTHTHITIHCTQRIYTPFFHTHVGNLEWNENYRGSTYIVLEKHKYRSKFKWKDVYCKECSKWHFHDIKGS